jgi:hypothetical protein
MASFLFVLRWLLLSIVPFFALEVIRALFDIRFFDGAWLLRWSIALFLLIVSDLTRPIRREKDLAVWPGLIGLVGTSLIGLAINWRLPGSDFGSWITVVATVGLILGLRSLLVSDRSWFIQGFSVVGAGFLASMIVVGLAQIESQFAQEEFFAAVDVLVLGGFFSLLSVSSVISERFDRNLRAFRGVSVRVRWVLIASVSILLGGTLFGFRTYQKSFYSSEVPDYPGITPSDPFICGTAYETPEDGRGLDGRDIFNDLVRELSQRSNKTPADYGMLAFMTDDRVWAEQFREALLLEAHDALFTGPAHSVKWGQYEASRRLYFYIKVREAFPDLFSEDDVNLLADWFADINRRALTVEWVDWLYGLAFSKWPEGPYENQEIGAGLLSLLEYGGLAAPGLSDENRAYLEREARGWQARFRNTDDAYTYQAVWIGNAYYQSLLDPDIVESNVKLSFEWLLLQALPDGRPLAYNPSESIPLAGPAYLGAELLGDPRLMWLAGRSLDLTEQQGEVFGIFPGISEAVSTSGRVPEVGSCLLYSRSGLPNQVGPLAPDKVVLRDGWMPDSKYLLLNLRFAGWHRYKATNTVTMMYKQKPIVRDSLEVAPADWLPEGRSLFRDKRVPRQDLNGLLVERSGMDAVVQALTGLGGPWAQDPPHYAEVLDFQTSDIMDSAHIRVDQWHGWTHDRSIYLHHDKDVIVVFDRALGPTFDPFAGEVAITWQAHHTPVLHKGSVLLDGDVKLVVLNAEREIVTPVEEDSLYRLQYLDKVMGELSLISLFLFDEWTETTVSMSASDSALTIMRDDGQRLEISIPRWFD